MKVILRSGIGLFLMIVLGLARSSFAQEGDGTLRRIKVPILMYHYVSALPEDADDIRRELTVSPEQFAAHVAYLKSAGYHTITLEALDRALTIGEALPPKPIALTFDDGYVDHYDNVWPVLLEADFTATFFIITGLADHQHSQYLSWPQIQQMANSGMSMQSHTKHHPDLTERDYDFLVYEILGSMESLESYTNREVTVLSYPSGRYDDLVLDVVDDTPLARAVTTQPGVLHTTDNRYELTRVRVPGNTSVLGLQYLLAGTDSATP